MGCRSRARSAQKCAQTRTPWPQCRVDANSHTPRVDHHMVVGARTVRIGVCAALRPWNAHLNA
eukprot:4125014-Lingulodinium_polyedra.AAC.1